MKARCFDAHAWDGAKALQRPLQDDALKIVMRGASASEERVSRSGDLSKQARLRLMVKKRNTRSEPMFSAVPPTADIHPAISKPYRFTSQIPACVTVDETGCE
jgi:hypothetical protein